MSNEWKYALFNECLEKVKKTTKLSSLHYKKEGIYPVVSQEKELISAYWNKKEDLFTHKTPVIVFGDHTKVVKYIDFNFVVGADGVKILLPKSFLLPKFFYYWVCSLKIPSLGYARHYRLLQEYTIHYPPLSEQVCIVEKLDNAFVKINALKKNAEQSLQQVNNLFQSILKEKLLPKKNWISCQLQDICSFFNGKPHEQDVDADGEYILVNSKFISSNKMITKRTSLQLFPLYKNDIVMVMSDVPNGKALAKCLIIDEDGRYTLNQRICVFRNSKINSQFLYYLINRNPYFLSFDNGENQTNLRKNDIISMPISYPSDPNEITQIIESLNDLIEKEKLLVNSYKKIVLECEALKQSLLKKAFSGEL